MYPFNNKNRPLMTLNTILEKFTIEYLNDIAKNLQISFKLLFFYESEYIVCSRIFRFFH